MGIGSAGRVWKGSRVMYVMKCVLIKLEKLAKLVGYIRVGSRAVLDPY